MDEARIESLGITPLDGRARGDRHDQRVQRSAGCVCARRAHRRAAAVLGERRRQIRSIPTSTRCTIGQVGSRHARSRLLPAQRRKFPRSRKAYTDLHRAALRARQTSPIRRARPARISRLETRSPRRSGIARAIAIAMRPTTRWRVARCRRSTPNFDWQAYSGGAAGRAPRTGQRRHRPPTRLHEGGRRVRSPRRRSRRGRNT